MIKAIKHLNFCILIFVVTACAGIHPDMSPIEKDVAAKQFRPAPGYSRIYLVRSSKFGGMGLYLSATLNKMVVGNLISGSYLMLEVSPGNYGISAAGDLDDPGTIDIAAEPDKLYFVKMHPVVGAVRPRLHIELATPEDGKALVNAYKRFKSIENNIPSQDFIPHSGDVTLYIIRPSMAYAVLKKFSPTVDNRVAGTLESGSYLVSKVSPGTHRISAAGKYEGVHTLDFEAANGQTHFFKFSPKMGFALPKIQIETISLEEGNRLIGKYKNTSQE